MELPLQRVLFYGRRTRTRFLATATILLLSGCTVLGPNYSRPEVVLPADWHDAPAGQSARSTPESSEHAAWWRSFGDPVLDTLITEAYRQNYSLQVAGLRVLEARAALGIAIGSQYPQVQQLQAGVSARQGSEAAANTKAGDLRYTQHDLGLSIGWEMDFWGRYRRAVESADAQLQGSVLSYDAALVVLVAQVADTYLQLRSVEEQLRIARENIDIARRGVAITELNFRNGNQSELDFQQARTQLLSNQALIPSLESARRQAMNALALLIGRPPHDEGLRQMIAKSVALPRLPETVAMGVPADLLRRRPDLQAAEQAARAAAASVGIAETDLYPSISLTGYFGLQAAAQTDTTRTGRSGASQLFRAGSFTSQFGPSMSWNIFNYGRLKNNVRVQDAVYQQALENYQQAVLSAAHEVDNALSGYQSGLEQSAFVAETVASARRSMELAQLRYREGLSDYQRVLDSQRTYFSQQLRHVELQLDSARSLVGLFKAMGGGWQLRGDDNFVSPKVIEEMRLRTDWGDLLDPPRPPEGAGDNNGR